MMRHEFLGEQMQDKKGNKVLNREVIHKFSKRAVLGGLEEMSSNTFTPGVFKQQKNRNNINPITEE